MMAPISVPTLLIAACCTPGFARGGLRSLMQAWSPVNPSCICALDFDETLRVPNSDYSDYDTPPSDAGAMAAGKKEKHATLSCRATTDEVIRACLTTPCKVAVASANGNREKLTSVLPRLYGNLGLFTYEFFESPAFQYGNSDKAPMLKAILNFFGIPSPSCMTLFDDKELNEKYAEQVGANFVLVDPSTGIQRHNFNAGMDAMPDECFPGGRPTKI
ncbi:hypothetical protein DUNSADRAFT_11873, partial [Dunaliella salina]